MLLKKSDTRLALKNTDGGLWLYGPGGVIVDQAHFSGTAPEGRSYSRVDYCAANIGHFAFLWPTPGEENRSFDSSVSDIKYPIGASISRELSAPAFLGILISVSVSLFLFFIYVTHTNQNVSHFLFRRDKNVGL